MRACVCDLGLRGFATRTGVNWQLSSGLLDSSDRPVTYKRTIRACVRVYVREMIEGEYEGLNHSSGNYRGPVEALRSRSRVIR